MKDLEINIDNDVLGFKPAPPRRTLWDLLPSWLLFITRRALSFPAPTAREKWFLCLYFVRGSLDTLIELNEEHNRAVVQAKTSTPSSPDPDDIFRWS